MRVEWPLGILSTACEDYGISSQMRFHSSQNGYQKHVITEYCLNLRLFPNHASIFMNFNDQIVSLSTKYLSDFNP